MSVIRVDEVGGKTLERAVKVLAGIEGGVQRAIKSAMPRAVSHLRTSSSKAIQEKYDISTAALRTGENISISYSYGNGVSALVNFHGHKMPLYRYGGAAPKNPTPDKSKWVVASIDGLMKRVHPGVAASGHQLKGTGISRFDDAFVARMKSGHTGIFERTGGATSSGSDQIREIMGSSIPQMLGSPEVQEQLVEGAMQKFEERLEHEVTRILNGWGGSS